MCDKFFYNYHHPKMTLSNQKWSSAPMTSVLTWKSIKPCLSYSIQHGVSLSALSAEKVSQMHELQHVLDRKVEKGGVECLETKITGTKGVRRLVSTWIKLVSRKLRFSKTPFQPF